MIGGFMGVGTPTKIIGALVFGWKKDSTFIANDAALPCLALVNLGTIVTPTGLGTLLVKGKQVLEVDNINYLNAPGVDAFKLYRRIC